MRTSNYLLLGFFSLLSFQSFSQNNELIVKPSINFLSFRGSGAHSETYSGTPVKSPKSPTVFNPYGTDGQIGYGVGLSFKRNTKSNLIFGLSGIIENTSTRINFSNGIIYDGRSILGNGHNELTLNYFTIQSYIGLRPLDETTTIEFKLLSEYCFLISSEEELTFQSTEGSFNFKNDREHNEQDLRLGLGMTVYVKRFAINFEYLLGLNDFDDYKQDDISIYSQLIRLGVSYSIMKKNSKNNDL